jgi:hypothetical protein
MAENIVAGLFGLTPQMYGEQQRQSALAEGIKLAQLDPASRGAAMTYAGARGLGGAFASALGVEDPQLKMISARNSIFQQIDQSNPESMVEGIKMLSQMGDNQGAMALADYYRKAQGDVAQTKQRLAAALASEATSKRERQQAIPNDIQIANEIATLETSLLDIENTPDSPDRTRAKNLLNSRLSALKSLAFKGEKAVAANIKEIGVAETTREPVYLDVNNDQQFIYKKDAEGKQVRVPFTGGVDRKISETKVTATASSKGAEEGAKTIAELDAKRLGAAQVSSGKAVEQAGLLQELLKTPQPIAGSGAPARVGALRVFSTFGLTSPKDDEALGNADKFNALAGERVISFIKALGSNPTDTDREFARTIGPALEKGTKTNTDLINFLLERSRKVVKDAESLETHFYNNNYSLRGYKSPFLSDLETPKSKASDLTTEELKRIARGKK